MKSPSDHIHTLQSNIHQRQLLKCDNTKQDAARIIVATRGIAVSHRLIHRICQVASMCTPCNTWFLGPTQVCPPNQHTRDSAVFCKGHSHDQHTERPCHFICSSRLHLCYHAMQPKNKTTKPRDTWAHILSQWS